MDGLVWTAGCGGVGWVDGGDGWVKCGAGVVVGSAGWAVAALSDFMNAAYISSSSDTDVERVAPPSAAIATADRQHAHIQGPRLQQTTFTTYIYEAERPNC